MQIIKQLPGAAAGALIAYAVYAGYTAAEPKLTAFTQTFWTGSDKGVEARFSEAGLDIDDRQMERQVSRNREIAKHFASNAQPGTNGQVPFSNIAEKANEFTNNLTPERESEIIEESEQVPFMDPAETEVPDEAPVQENTANLVPVNPEWEQDWNEMEKEPVVTGEDLPDSGIGLGLVIMGAAAGAAGLRKRKLAY